MSQRSVIILVVLTLLFDSEIFGQDENGIKNCKLEQQFPGIRLTTQSHKLVNIDGVKFKYPVDTCLLKNFDFEKILLYGLDTNQSIKKSLITKNTFLSPSYYTSHLGFFCIKELQLEKITSVPIRIRLGSLNYVNYLEQKPNALKGF